MNIALLIIGIVIAIASIVFSASPLQLSPRDIPVSGLLLDRLIIEPSRMGLTGRFPLFRKSAR